MGYSADRVVGRRCSALAGEVGGLGLTEDCAEGCLMVRSLRAGLVPAQSRVRMRCAWGQRKWLVVSPMVVSGLEQGGPLLFYLFGDEDEVVPPGDVQQLVALGAPHADSAPPSVELPPVLEPLLREVRLTARETEVLSYLALGWETKYIAEEMEVSWYTARNHVENVRRKLGATTRLEAVMVAMRLGLLPSGSE